MHLNWAVVHKFNASCLDFSRKFARGGSGDASDLGSSWRGQGMHCFFGEMVFVIG